MVEKETMTFEEGPEIKLLLANIGFWCRFIELGFAFGDAEKRSLSVDLIHMQQHLANKGIQNALRQLDAAIAATNNKNCLRCGYPNNLHEAGVACEPFKNTRDETSNLKNKAWLDQFIMIQCAIGEYHDALTRREHGHVASALAINKIETALGLFWKSSNVEPHGR